MVRMSPLESPFFSLGIDPDRVIEHRIIQESWIPLKEIDLPI